MLKRLFVSRHLLLISWLSSLFIAQGLNQSIGKQTTSSPSPDCHCCHSCSSTDTTTSTVFHSGKNRKRNCTEVKPLGEKWWYQGKISRKPILIVVETFLPYINVSGNDSSSLEISGPMADLLAVLAQTVKFKYCLVRSPDREFGSKDENNTYTGIYGMMKNYEVDMALGPIIRTVDRFEIMDFSTTIHFETLGALFGKPTVRRNVYNYVMAFTWQVWLVIIFTLCCVGATAVFLYTCGPDPAKNRPLTFHFASEQFWLFFGVMVSQGMNSPPRRCPVRVLNSFWWLVAIILTAYYNSKLIALMVTVKSYNSLDELLLPQTDTNVFISASTLSDIKDTKSIYNALKFKSDNGSDTQVLNDDNMDLVATGNYAIVAFRSAILTAVSRRFERDHKCEFNTGRDSYTFSKEMSIGYSKLMSQPLKHAIDLSLVDLYGKGVFNSMLRHVLNTRVNCMLSASVGGGAMTMDDVNGMFLLWLYGMTSAFVALLIEGIFHRLASRKKVIKVEATARRQRKESMTRGRSDSVSGFVERHQTRRRQNRGFSNRPFYLAYNNGLPNRVYHFG